MITLSIFDLVSDNVDWNQSVCSWNVAENS